ncbi:MAG: hypothetical protein IJ622_10710 [Bacteroidales bacterium]|nr:hypothetical protein [Bacteroidales bacterium]
MIRIYTIKDLTDWLVDGLGNGLSESIISKTRAWAFINNPCADDTTPAVAVLFEGDETKGYAAVFPERFEHFSQKIYWGSTFFVDAYMRGKGCGAKLLAGLEDSLDGIYATTQTPPSSSAIFKKLGAQETWFPEYWFKLLKFNPAKGNHKQLKRYANHLHPSWAFQHAKRIKWCNSFRYRLEYCSFIDDDTFLFMQKHRQNDVMMRSRKMLNWMLAYPFLQTVVLQEKAYPNKNYFSCYKTDFCHYAVKVYDENDFLTGVYIFKYSGGEANLLYLYYDEKAKDLVMASFYEHLIRMEAVRLRTTHREFVSFVKRYSLPFLNLTESKLNLCAPGVLVVPEGVTIQGGDGDMFVI